MPVLTVSDAPILTINVWREVAESRRMTFGMVIDQVTDVLGA